MDWDQQDVFWTPQCHSAIVFLAAITPAPPTTDDRSQAIALESAIPATDGLYLRFRSHRTDSQMIALNPTKGGPLVAVVPLDADGLDRIREVERVWRSLHGRAVAANTALTKRRRSDLRQMLRTIDGRTEGATLREIARVFFGDSRVASEPWKTSSLRDRMNRLARGGQMMIDGGYRTLLRSRRS